MSDVAEEGFAPQAVHFALQIDESGELQDIVDLRDGGEKGNKKQPRRILLPSLGKKSTSGIDPNFLWGKVDYVLGRNGKGKQERAANCRKAFVILHETLLDGNDMPESGALLRFLRNHFPAGHPRIETYWREMAGGNLVFRVGQRFLHNIPELKDIWKNRNQKQASSNHGICMVTGKQDVIAQLHPAVKGVYGAHKSGASLSSYNQLSFESFEKKQNQNAPVSKRAAFAYTTALNYLIRHDLQSLLLGKTTVVCWAEKPCPLEAGLFELFSGSSAPSGEQAEEVDGVSTAKRAAWLRKIAQGMPMTEVWPDLDPDVRMYVLALAPNNSRLSVSFFLQGPAKDFLRHIRDYYKKMEIIRRFDDDPEFPSVWQLARAVLGEHKKMADIKRLGEELLHAALSGALYPAHLLSICLERLRSGDDCKAVHAGLLKAILFRNYHQEVGMSLNTEHASPAYQLGRLFALLVALQRKAIGQNINADIRDKYYGSASTTPSVVFPLLLRGAQNHISKADAFGYDKLIREVLNHIQDAFPAHLNLEQQGLFALGYYHQRADKAVKQDEDAVSGTQQ
jgi:CRISPR-associated protein Csd1